MPKLFYLFFIPILSSFLFLFIPRSISTRYAKKLAFLLSLMPLLILLSTSFSRWLGEEMDYAWLPSLSIHFHLHVDTLSLLFLYLTAIIIPMSVLTVKQDNAVFPQGFYGFILLLQGLLIGFFTARDLALFTIFWEAMLIPLYFIILLWGGAKRQGASLTFLVYMIAGSALMVAAVLSLYIFSGSVTGVQSFSFDHLNGVSAAIPYAPALFAIFALAFAVKTPLFPFHAWLPEVYYQAPIAGTILLSALLSKAGIYGFLRIGLGIFPQVMQMWSPWLLGLAIIGVIYGGLAAWMQNDYKRLIAYSSFSHVNFILAGIFVWSQMAHDGALIQALNHGITIAGLFLVVGWLEERLGSSSMYPFSGVAKFFPCLCWLSFIFVLSSIALPGTNNFIGELFILFGLFSVHPFLAAILGLTIILSVIYMLRWMQTVYFGPSNFDLTHLQDITGKQIAIALPLVILVFWLGMYPAPILTRISEAQKNNVGAIPEE